MCSVVSIGQSKPVARNKDGEDELTEGFMCYSQEFGLFVALGAIKCCE